MSGRLSAIIGATFLGCVAWALAPTAAPAQVNIDQGKTPAQIFANSCAACHKAPRGLGAGKNSYFLASFLREHYTSSREEAAALAAYVLGAGGNAAGNDAAARGQKPGQADHPKTEPATHGATPGAPPATAPATAKLQEPKSEEEPTAVRHEPASASRARRKEPDASPAAAQEPAAVVAEPAAAAAGPANSESGETAPVPRDDIPD